MRIAAGGQMFSWEKTKVVIFALEEQKQYSGLNVLKTESTEIKTPKHFKPNNAKSNRVLLEHPYKQDPRAYIGCWSFQ